MTVAVFNYGIWAARYPELASSVNADLAGAYFFEAGFYLDNTDGSPCDPPLGFFWPAGYFLGATGSPVPCDPTTYQPRLTLLNMLTAHIAALNAPLNGQPSSPLVGRISQASEGSVSVTTELELPKGTAQFFGQTKYGLAFWAASAAYRQMKYRPPAPNFAGGRGGYPGAF